MTEHQRPPGDRRADVTTAQQADHETQRVSPAHRSGGSPDGDHDGGAPGIATVHEIVGQWRSGQEPLAPPGISDPTRRNFAQPLNANVFVGPLVPFDGPAGPGLLITFNYDLPAAKVVGTGEFFVIGAVDGAPLYLEGIEPNPAFAAFAHCPRLAG